MNVDVVSFVSRIHYPNLKDRTVIVIDVLRATSVIIVALKNGAESVVPVLSAEEAREKADENSLLCGERNAVALPGFDAGNSPLEFAPDFVQNKQLVLTTSNGTKAIKQYAEASSVLIGAFLNAQAVSVSACKTKKDIVLVCSGTNGKYSLEDVLCAGMIVNDISKICDVELTDEALAAKLLWIQSSEDLHGVLSKSHHYKVLKKLGFEADLEFCLGLNTAPIVPVYQDGIILKQKEPEINE